MGGSSRVWGWRWRGGSPWVWWTPAVRLRVRRPLPTPLGRPPLGPAPTRRPLPTFPWSPPWIVLQTRQRRQPLPTFPLGVTVIAHPERLALATTDRAHRTKGTTHHAHPRTPSARLLKSVKVEVLK